MVCTYQRIHVIRSMGTAWWELVVGGGVILTRLLLGTSHHLILQPVILCDALTLYAVVYITWAAIKTNGLVSNVRYGPCRWAFIHFQFNTYIFLGFARVHPFCTVIWHVIWYLSTNIVGPCVGAFGPKAHGVGVCVGGDDNYIHATHLPVHSPYIQGFFHGALRCPYVAPPVGVYIRCRFYIQTQHVPIT